MTLGLFALTFVGTATGYGLLAVGMTLFGVGVGLFFSSATTAGVTALDPAHSSLAGGILYMFQVAGGSIGLGLTTAIFTAISQSKVHSTAIADVLNKGQEHAVNGILAGTDNAHDLLQRFQHSRVLLTSIARHAFVDGVQTAFIVAASLAAVAFVIAVSFIKGRPRLREAAAAEPSPAAA
jgi:hypothetical protein